MEEAVTTWSTVGPGSTSGEPHLPLPTQATPGEKSSMYFGILDYSVFVMLLAISSLVGVYFAFCAKQKQNTTQEYLMGGRTMGVFPISMSLIASYISGVSSLGVPAEVYTYGTQYSLVMAAEVAVCVSVAYIFMPVFYKLQLTSAYKYLELRYDQRVRLLLSGISVITMVLYVPLMIYVPALAFSQVSGANIYVISPIICAVCIFYTSLGGLKAVVWADTIQSFSMLTGVVVVSIMGTISAGGASNVFEKNYKSGRLEFFKSVHFSRFPKFFLVLFGAILNNGFLRFRSMDMNPLVRHTFWTVFIGNFFMWLSHCAASQAILQRCLALPTIQKARRAVLSLAVGISCFVVLFIYTGMVIYANYHDCDPVRSKKIRKSDQILPYLVMHFGNAIPGLPGLFIAGIFSASLSSMSTLLNAATAMIIEDFIKPWTGFKMSESQASTTMKFTVLILGIISTALVLVVDRLGAIIQASRSLSGISAGPSLGIFVFGLLTPWMNAKGALVGGIAGFIVSAWISVGAQLSIAKKWLRFPTKPVTLEGCPQFSGINYTNLSFGMATDTHVPEHDDVFWLYRVSYLYYTLIGFLAMGVVGMIVSYLTGFEDVNTLDRNLLCTISHRLLPKKSSPIPPESSEAKELLGNAPKVEGYGDILLKGKNEEVKMEREM